MGIRTTQPSTSIVEIGVVRLPHLANFDEFAALASEPGVSLRYVRAYTRGVRDYVRAFLDRDAAAYAEVVPILIEHTTVKDPALFETPAGYAKLSPEAAAPLLGIRLARPPTR